MARKGFRSITIKEEIAVLLHSIMEKEHRGSMSSTIDHLAKEYMKSLKQEEGGKHEREEIQIH